MPHSSCRRCSKPLPTGARAFCSAACRKTIGNELRLLRHRLASAEGDVAFYSYLVAHPVVGMATPEYAAERVNEGKTVAATVAEEIARLKGSDYG